MKQYSEIVLGGDALHQVHHQLVMVISQVHVLEDRSQLKLVGGRFVVAGLDGNAKFMTFDFQFFHEVGYTRWDGAKIVVVQLLVLRRGVSHQGASGNAQVRTGIVQGRIYQEVFLFPSKVGIYTLHIGHEHPAYFGCCLVYCCQCFQKRCLVVQCFTGIGDEDGRNTQGLVHNEGRRRHVPRRVASGFECVTDTSVRKTGSIRFLLDKQLAGKTFNHISVITEFDESVVFLGGAVGKGLEPVGIMSYVESLCPAFHAIGNHVRHFAVERNTLLDGVDDCFVSFARKKFLHFLTVEHMSTVVFRKFFYWIIYRNRASVGQFLKSKKSHF